MNRKRILLSVLLVIILLIPSFSLADSDYEEGDGWIYRDGELKITTNNGLIHFLYHEFDMLGDSQHKHTSNDVDRVIIGKDVTDIIIDYFIGDYNPTSTSVEAGNDTFVINGGWVINKKTNTLFGAANVKQNKNRSEINDLPSYIEHIGMYAFSDCSKLKQIKIPDRVISICDSSFRKCESLESITLPNTITSIGVSAFGRCTNLTHVNLEANLQNIGIAAFDACVNLETPKIYNTKIETVHENSFWGCDQFQTVEFPSTLKVIKASAFMLCNRLNTLIFNSDQLIIEDGAFSYCENVRTLVFTKGKPTSIGTKLFDEDGRTPDGKSFISYFKDRNGETIAYPTLYYTAAYAGEWAPNGETDWNGYPIQQISQEELDAILAEARGETSPESVALSPAPTQAPTAASASTPQPDATSADASAFDGWMVAAAAVAAIAVGAIMFSLVRKRKNK
ncbi:MAG: leucine-rich repeat domain-containing protein [Christensenella sp.]|nr:leucine-rich repeat domain-containing protein [Christensenella sp.]